jgi:hypothetical protein
MKRGSRHRWRVLILAVWLGLSMSLSFVKGSVMAAEMAISAESGHRGPSDCDGCGGSGHKNADVSICLSVCGSGSLVLMPAHPAALPSASRPVFEIAHLIVSGQTSSPDHSPPKILTLS